MAISARGGLEPRFRVLFSAIFHGVSLGNFHQGRKWRILVEAKLLQTAASLRTCFALVISAQVLNRSPRFWGVLERGTPKYRTKSFVPCGYVAGDSFVNLSLGP